ncbi:cytochrome b5-like heme/steroid binding domain-containing protein [Thelephora terrestris]|uniref:Cytochrome b5-like heme/steroid binding domain-containing protein n=1 Tax=Thelephora terrestris TaxID=56493 RepID=A0A9P6HD41_9AGAM|nr:cytochrome b5-like heme/steroid binding domain-containing protein [Thelephora terrestris]
MASNRTITFEELKAHTTKDSLWLLIEGKVYDATKFIDEHPGGDEVLFAEAGRDATEAFEDVGHSDEARGYLPPMYIGDFEKDGALKFNPGKPGPGKDTPPGPGEKVSNLMYFIPLSLMGAYFAWKFYSGA